MYTFFCTFGSKSYAQSVLINIFSASELSRRFVKSALLVGSTEKERKGVKKEKQSGIIITSPPSSSSQPSSQCSVMRTRGRRRRRRVTHTKEERAVNRRRRRGCRRRRRRRRLSSSRMRTNRSRSYSPPSSPICFESIIPYLDSGAGEREPNQQRTLNKLPTDPRCRNFVTKRRLSIQVGVKCAKKHVCNVYVFQLSILHITVGGWEREVSKACWM